MDDEDVPERKKPSISMEKLAELDTQSPSDASDEDPLVSQLNLDKLMSDKGLQMNQTVVSEPDGWEVTPDADVSVDQKNSSKADVTLQEVNSESDKEWLKQFEEEQQASTSTDYRSIDELLAEAEQQDDGDKPELSANLDVGFDEYPDVIPDHDDVDIDDDGGVGAKLDLARAYLEIDDKASAKELLLEVQAEGDDKQIKEAEKLLTKIG
jgi:pilus assembly protein FimV